MLSGYNFEAVRLLTFIDSQMFSLKQVCGEDSLDSGRHMSIVMDDSAILEMPSCFVKMLSPGLQEVNNSNKQKKPSGHCRKCHRLQLPNKI